MLTGLKILIFSMLWGGNKNLSPTPYMISKVEFLGFFGGNKYCYYRNSFIQKRGNGWSEEIQEFVVKDFNGKEILREVVKREEEKNSDYPASIIKTEYLGKTNIIEFLRNNNVQKGERYISFKISVKSNQIIKINDNYPKKTQDTLVIVDSSIVNKSIAKHNKEPIFVEYEKNEWLRDIELGDWERELLYSNVVNIFNYKNKYLLILNDYRKSSEEGDIDCIILVDASILDKVFKR